MERTTKVVCDLGVGGQRGRVTMGGSATAISATEYKDPPKDNKEIYRLGQVHTKGSQSGIVYHREGIFPTLIAGTHGYAMGYVLKWVKSSSKGQ